MDYESPEIEANFDLESPGKESSDDTSELKRLDTLEAKNKEFVQDLRLNSAQKQKKSKCTIENKMEDLLEQAETYASFLLSRTDTRKHKKEGNLMRRRGSYDEGDNEVEDLPTRLFKQPSFLVGGNLKEFQLYGLNWLIALFETGINGILADEMGLGKTIQTIALIAFLREFKHIHGPFLIVGPKSTLGNWFKEFKLWLPNCRVLKLLATKEEREDILKNHLLPNKFDVCLTSFEGISICRNQLMKFKWKYIIIDEAHRIKNEESVLSTNVRMFQTNNKLLLTGTPLQNNLHELWSLLNFIMPNIFDSAEIFDALFSSNSNSEESEIEDEKVKLDLISKLHKIIRPFMLRRTKEEVERSLPPKKEIYLCVGMSDVQVDLYKNMLKSRTVIDNDSKNVFLNIIMQLRKICNHPYLFDGVEEPGLPVLGEHLIFNSGKMMVLDKLLQRLKSEQHQVLIFSQMTSVLDILEDYCNYRQFNYCRIDGSTDMIARDNQINDFTSENSNKFVFLLSTRAGGLGINLASADTVIIYDSDWNPQVDLQAMDRAHRIGQKNTVKVFRLITENTIEEKIIERQIIKLKWDSMVIQNAKFSQKSKSFSKDQLKEMIQFGAAEIFKSEGATFTDKDLEVLMSQGEEMAIRQGSEIEKKFNNSLLDLGSSTIDIYEFQNVNYQGKKKEDEEALQEAMYKDLDNDFTRTRRERKIIYDLTPQPILPQKPPTKPKVIKLPDYQFIPNDKKDRLIELLLKESEIKSHRKFRVPGEIYLSPEENKEKEGIINEGFPNWSRNDYLRFVQAVERFGRDDLSSIFKHMSQKTEDEVLSYMEVFWKRLEELVDASKIIRNVEKTEKNIRMKVNAAALIQSKIESYNDPKEDIEFTPALYNKIKSDGFTIIHDKHLLYFCSQFGFGNWVAVKNGLKKESIFRFDHFIRSRNDADLNKRMLKLLKIIEKEQMKEEEPVEKDTNEVKEREEKEKVDPPRERIEAKETTSSLKLQPSPEDKTMKQSSLLKFLDSDQQIKKQKKDNAGKEIIK